NKLLQINLFPMVIGINCAHGILYSQNLFCLPILKHSTQTLNFIMQSVLSLMRGFGIWTWHFEVFPKMFISNGMISIITDVLCGFCLMKLRLLKTLPHFFMTKRTLG